MSNRRGRGRGRDDDQRSQFEQRVIDVNRVAKVQQGGRRFSFTALVVMGDRAGKVGVGYGKAKEVGSAIQKAEEYAKRDMAPIPMIGATLPHSTIGADGAARVMLKPAAPGTGVIAGGPVRAVLECAGVEDCLAKILGTNNAINVVHATMSGLRGLRTPEEVAELRGKPVDEVASPVMLKRMAAAESRAEETRKAEAEAEARKEAEAEAKRQADAARAAADAAKAEADAQAAKSSGGDSGSGS